jgi:hypothetical protein
MFSPVRPAVEMETRRDKMKRTLTTVAALIGVIGLASAANAASLALDSNCPGEVCQLGTLTLTLTATNAGETDAGVIGVLLFNNALLDPPAQATQTPLVSAGVTWTQGGLAGFCNDANGRCRMFNQTRAGGAAAIDNGGTFQLSTVTFTAVAQGTATFTWMISPLTPATQRLDYFGVTNSPGLTITIVPEPTTAALLGLGLLGLAVAGRRR